MDDQDRVENGSPSRPPEEHERISSDEDQYNHEQDPHHNISFSSAKEARNYERKKANALLANPLRGYSHKQLRKMGKEYALGAHSPTRKAICKDMLMITSRACTRGT